MAWNEPGGNSNNQDPWGGRKARRGRREISGPAGQGGGWMDPGRARKGRTRAHPSFCKRSQRVCRPRM